MYPRSRQRRALVTKETSANMLTIKKKVKEKKRKKRMINTESIEPIVGNILTPEEGRTVDPFNDPEMMRLVAVNLELAVRNLIQAKASPECLVLTADICTHRLVAMPTDDGDVNVLVFES